MANLLVPHGFEANYIVGFARGLRTNGVRFTVISDDETAPQLNAAGIAHRNLRGSLDPGRPALRKFANLFRYYVALLWTVYKYRGGTIHFNGVPSNRVILIDSLVLPLWFRLWAGRYIYTAHNTLPHSKQHNVMFRLAYRCLYRFPNAIIAHTSKVAKQLQSEFAVQPRRISVISIGLNEEVAETDLSAAGARRQLSLPSSGTIALFFGKVEPYKGVDLLVEAWNLVVAQDVRLAIVGECPDVAYARRIRNAVAISSRPATIEWREGFIPNSKVALWFKACDIVVMPYRHVYQSGVVYLCKRLGMPIVATNVDSLAEIIDPNSGIIASSNDPIGIAQALDQFFANPGRFDHAEIARRNAKHTWAQECACVKHLYN